MAVSPDPSHFLKSSAFRETSLVNGVPVTPGLQPDRVKIISQNM